MYILESKDLVKEYGESKSKTYALNNVDFNVEQGEIVAIIGASGSGKTTLLNILGGLDFPNSGVVSIKNTDIAKLNDSQLTIFRRKNIGFIFQDFNLLPSISTYENITLPVGLDNGKLDTQLLDTLLEFLNIKSLLKRYPHQISGGQKQRVAIARALIMKPAIVLADEPTGNLDSTNSLEVISLLKTLAKKLNQTVIIVTHDNKIAEKCDRIVTFEDGKIKMETSQ